MQHELGPHLDGDLPYEKYVFTPDYNNMVNDYPVYTSGRYNKKLYMWQHYHSGSDRGAQWVISKYFELFEIDSSFCA